ncbi:unnamed protein product [Mytilus coruscus]|uniref:Uncharacterized protein n=1 Tax=Mytilus coruscus TaxID=42192 RepID=A0A6J8E8S9_MYTCO|nr:unnamed protein product [Mytilus coruscus]
MCFIGNAEISKEEKVREPINAQLKSDLQEARENIKQLQDLNSKLQHEQQTLIFRTRDQAYSLQLSQRKDEIYAKQCKELDRTKNKLKLAEKKLSKIESKDFVRQHTLLLDEVAASKEQSLEEKCEYMQRQNIRMEHKLDEINIKLDTLFNMMYEPRCLPSGRSSRSVPFTLGSGPTILMSGRSSESGRITGRSAAQVVKLPQIKRVS